MTATPEKPEGNSGGHPHRAGGWSYSDWAGIVYPARNPRGFHEATYLADFFDTHRNQHVVLTIRLNAKTLPPMDRARLGHPPILFTAKLWQKFSAEPDGG